MACKMLDLSESNGQRVDTLITLKFPTYLINHPNKRLWLLHQHRSAYDFWGTAYSDLSADPLGPIIRDLISSADKQAFSEHTRLFTISQNVSNRLKSSTGFDAPPVYPPVADSADFFTSDAEDYILFPSRVNSTKRQYLVARALAKCKSDARIIFSGPIEDRESVEKELRALADSGMEGRAQFIGSVSREKLIDLYARCKGVIFIPQDEDYGYITPEAMYAGKPVITATDSGGSLEFVENEVTGLIVKPIEQEIADAIDRIWDSPAEAKLWGEQGKLKVSNMNLSWENVLENLLG